MLILSFTLTGNPLADPGGENDRLLSDPATSDDIGSGADSIMLMHINEVVIEKHRSAYYHEDKRTAVPDTLTRQVFSGGDIGTILPVFTTAYINTQGGAGSASSLFLRGTNSYQSAISWNGFILNSLTLGTTDLSLIPVSAADDIKVIYGAAGSLAGSGNSGGSVLLGNRANWSNRVKAELKSELGTYDNRYLSATTRFGTPRIQYHLNMFLHQAENDFKYTDIYKPGNPVERIHNNAMDNRGIIQNLFVRLPRNNRIEAGLWYQSREKELPAIMGSYLPGRAVQYDSSVRGYAKWSKIWHSSTLSAGAALFDEIMVYNGGNAADISGSPLESEITSTRLMSDINYRLYITNYLSADGGITFSSLTAEAGAWGTSMSEYRAAAVTAVKMSLPVITINTSARKEYHPGTSIPLLLSAGARADILPGSFAVTASYSDQFRVPSFNDKYWQPGGNPGLLPETGYTADTGMEWSLFSSRSFNIETGAGVYITRLKNMIQWVPSETRSWWYPENKDMVSVKGIEASLSAGGNTTRLKYSAGVAYNFSKPSVSSLQNGSTLNDTRLLRYVPLHSGTLNLNVASGNIYMGLTANYTGSRHTTADNNPIQMMPSHKIFNVWAGYRVSLGGVDGRIQLRVMNLLDEDYQVVRSYAMPGRTIHLGFIMGYSYSE